MPSRRRAVLLLAALVAFSLAGCDSAGPTQTTRLSPAPAGSPPRTGQPTATDAPGSIATPPSAPWPEGWDEAFCATFAELVVMQELAVDIGRALDEDARDDARALTAELEASATSARQLLGEVPQWDQAEALRGHITTLLGLADEMALRYGRYFEQNRRRALTAARNAGAQMTQPVEAISDELARLSERGLRCPGLNFELEAPGDR